MKLKRKTEILRNCSFLGGVEEETLRALSDRTEILEIDTGKTIVTKGEQGSRMFFIASGEVRVHDGDILLARLAEGEVFGEMAVLDSDVRSASVTAETTTKLLSLARADLWHVISTSSQALKTIIASVLQRERGIVHDVTTRTAQLQAYEKELEIGRRIQADFLPEHIPDIENWEVAAYFEAAREVAGDFYDIFELKPANQLAIVIGDVCDKGVGAALFMTLFRSLIRASCQQGILKSGAEPADGALPELITDILKTSIDFTNRYIATTHSKSSMFASVFFGILDPQSGELHYINGGHESPMILRADGALDVLEVTGGVLGLFPFAQFSTAAAQLNPGDLIFAYTDGINEAKNSTGDQFTDDRIVQELTSGQHHCGELLDTMLSAVKTFRGDAAQSDDITMLALRNFAPGEAK